MQKQSSVINEYSIAEKVNDSKCEENTMEIVGEGAITTQPDIITIEIGVQTSSEDLMDAKNENAEKTIKVIEGLIDMGVDSKDIQTINYNVSRQYDYVEGKRIEKDYVVSNILKVIIREIDQVGEIIDEAIENGANVIRRVTFDLSNSADYYQQALNLAMDDAMDKAISLGEHLGVKVNEIPIKIVEQQYRQTAMSRNYSGEDGGFETPIESGEIEIMAKINTIFNYYN